MQTAIAYSVNNWLQEHPAVFRCLEILIWMSNHPIISAAMVLVGIAIAWQLIKAVGYVLEVVARSLLQAPVKLLQFLFGITTKSLTNLGGLAVQQLIGTNNTAEPPVLPPADNQPVQPDQQQRLAEISTRLEALQKEQNELLQEAAILMASTAPHPTLEKTQVRKIIA